MILNYHRFHINNTVCLAFEDYEKQLSLINIKTELLCSQPLWLFLFYKLIELVDVTRIYESYVTRNM